MDDWGERGRLACGVRRPAECRDGRNGTLRPATGTVALPIPIVAADVSPLIIPARGKFESAHQSSLQVLRPGRRRLLRHSEFRIGNGHFS
jgi:hypothetical protein